MRHQEAVLDVADVFDKRAPRLGEVLRLLPAVEFVVGFLVVVLRKAGILVRTYAGDCDSVDAVVGMVYTLLASVFLLYSPHLAEIARGNAFHHKHLFKHRFEVETGIARNHADVGSLSAREALRDFGHGETAVFTEPIVALEREEMATLNVAVFVLLGGRARALEAANLLTEFLGFLLPVGDAREDFLDVGELRG